MSLIDLKAEGLQTILAPYTATGFMLMFLLSALAFRLCFRKNDSREQVDRVLFWSIGIVLIAFTFLRPIGIARDDLAYLEMIQGLRLPDGGCLYGDSINRDYVWCGIVRQGLLFFPENIRVALGLSVIGLLVKLFVIDQLCKQRLLSLLLFVPLCYIQYDLTQLRAGFAISWLFLGVYFLIRSQALLGGFFMFSNFAAHSQAAFSPALLGYRIFNFGRWILPVGITLAIVLMYSGLYPNAEMLSSFQGIKGLKTYLISSGNAAYTGIKIFPLGYFLILGYGIWLCDLLRFSCQKLSYIVSMSLFTGMTAAWFFAVNPTIQARVFEFYAVPLVLLAGNIGYSRPKTVVTCVLSLVLYMRLELLNDWILG